MCLRAVVLRLEHASESPGRLVTVTDCWPPPTGFPTQEVWVGPLVWGPLLEDHVLRVVSGGTPGDEESAYQQEVLPDQGRCALGQQTPQTMKQHGIPRSYPRREK